MINSIGISCGIAHNKNYGFRNNKILNEEYPIMYHVTFSSITEDISKYLAHPVKAERSKVITSKLRTKERLNHFQKMIIKVIFMILL